MDFKKIITEMLDNLKKNEITLSTEFNNNSEIIDKSKIGGKPYLPFYLALLSKTSTIFFSSN